MRTLQILLLVATLAGCEDDADFGIADDFTCKAMKPGQHYCGDCPDTSGGEGSPPFVYQDVDGDLNTAYEVYFAYAGPGEDGTLVRGVGSQGGTTIEAGEKPGVIFRFPTGVDVTMAATFRTLLNGAVQEELQVIPEQTMPASGEVMYLGFSNPTTLPYDQLELGLLERQPAGKNHVYGLYEFCLNGGAR
jgi:hypothetical protein